MSQKFPQADIDRFERKYMPEPNSGCWLWLNALDKGGYGVFTIRRGVGNKANIAAHRFSYETYAGPIPEGRVVDHLCRVRSCVNPSHMELVTQRENVLRGDLGKRMVATLCENGHPFSFENTVVDGKDKVTCLTCGSVYRRCDPAARIVGLSPTEYHKIWRKNNRAKCNEYRRTWRRKRKA